MTSLLGLIIMFLAVTLLVAVLLGVMLWRRHARRARQAGSRPAPVTGGEP
jgi:uncharacterized iron-regulated membrane protein